MILAKDEETGGLIDKCVFPGMQGGPIMQMIAAKAVAFHEAAQPEFKGYAKSVLSNAKVFAEALLAQGVKLITNGTDNHLLLIDCVASWGKDGREVQEKLDRVEITLNKNVIPDDPKGPVAPSGVRIGTPALTTRGMGAAEVREIAVLIGETMDATTSDQISSIKRRVTELCNRFPIPVPMRPI